MPDWMSWEQARVEAAAGRDVLLVFEAYGTSPWVHPARLRGAAVEQWAASAPGQPVNWEHLSWPEAPRQGVILEAEALLAEERIRTGLHITGEHALSDIAAGVRLRTSIEATPIPASCQCAICGAGWWDIEASCAHVPLSVYGGATCHVDAYEASADGIALTTSPAYRSSSIVGSFWGQSLESWSAPAMLRGQRMGLFNRNTTAVLKAAADAPAEPTPPEQATEDTATASEEAATMADVTALGERIDALEQALSALLEQLSQQAAPAEPAQAPEAMAASVTADVQALMRRAPVRDVQAATKLRASIGPERWSEVIAMLSPAQSPVGTRSVSSPAAIAASALRTPGPIDRAEARERAKALQASSGRPYLDCLREVKGE